MRTLVVGWLGLLSLAVVAPESAAQAVSFEAHGGIGIPDAPLLAVADGPSFGEDSGPSWRLGLALELVPGLHAQAGFGANSFACESFCRLSSNGWEAGVRGQLRTRFPVEPWIGGGVLLHSLDLRFTRIQNDQPIWIVTDTGTGLFLNGGVSIKLGEQLAVVPGARFHRYSVSLAEVAPEGGITGVDDHDIGFVSLTLGIRFRP